MLRKYALAALAVVAVIVLTGCPPKPAEKPKVEAPEFEAALETLGPMTCAYMTQMGPYAGSADAFKRLEGWARSRKLEPTAVFGVYYDDPSKVKADSLKYDVCIGVPKGTKPDKKAGVLVREMTSTQIAATLHTGPMDRVSETYMALAKWIGEQQLEVAGPGHEFLSKPDSTGKMSVKVCFPVKPMAPPAETGAAQPKTDGTAEPPKTGR